MLAGCGGDKDDQYKIPEPENGGSAGNTEFTDTGSCYSGNCAYDSATRQECLAAVDACRETAAQSGLSECISGAETETCGF